MSPAREIIAKHLMDTRDANGIPIRIGAGATENGRVVMIHPPSGIPPLNADDAIRLVKCIRGAVSDAVTHR